MKYDFSGWATKNDLVCTDGRTIIKDAFKHSDGAVVPLVWNHQHNSVENVLGQALLENREEGVYAYGSFNETDQGRHAKELLKHGDITSLSIFATQLKERGHDVLHGEIKEVSLVLAGANPGAMIDSVIAHGNEFDESAVIYTGEFIDIPLEHSEKEEKEEPKVEEEKKEEKKTEKTIGDILDTLNEEQAKAVEYVVAQALKEDPNKAKDDDEDEEKEMKHNEFDRSQDTKSNVLSHAAQGEILNMAKQTNVGSLQTAIRIYNEEHDAQLMHAETNPNGMAAMFDNYGTLFPDYHLMNPGAPEMITRDQTWISAVMSGVTKSPFTRIRTRRVDARNLAQAKGYQKGTKKVRDAKLTLLNRTTDPQTVYVTDKLERDDIIDITDFDIVEYQWKVMRMMLQETLAMAILFGDGREEGDEHKIHEANIRSIWHDDELYTMHVDVDFDAMKKELQGAETNGYFGQNFIYAESIIQYATYAREKYRGSGSLAFYCTPHLLNQMLLSRDRNGHRIFSGLSDLTSALNVTAIHTVEQMEGLTRTDENSVEKKLLGIFVNLNDYQVGSTKGGEITTFDDFDIDYNQYKYLIETRLSGSLVVPYSAIALEEKVAG